MVECELEAVVVGVEGLGGLFDVFAWIIIICVLDDGDGVFCDLEGEVELFVEGCVPGAEVVVDGDV